MGNILIWLILLVTIPRWAMTLQQVDRYTILGIPIAAIGEGIVLELGCLYIIQVFSAAKAKALEYRAKWEAHTEAMEEQGKHNRKPENDPRLTGYKVLMGAFSTLLLLTLAAQTPFIMAQFLPDETMADLLSRQILWGYSFVLVISPEVMTAAIALALHYHGVVKRIDGDEEKSIFAAIVAIVKDKRAVADVDTKAAPQLPKGVRKQRATVTDWRAICAGMNGNRAELDAGAVEELVIAAGFASPSRRTMQNWAKEAQLAAQLPQQEQDEIQGL